MGIWRIGSGGAAVGREARLPRSVRPALRPQVVIASRIVIPSAARDLRSAGALAAGGWRSLAALGMTVFLAAGSFAAGRTTPLHAIWDNRGFSHPDRA